jgi:hypothetical protein
MSGGWISVMVRLPKYHCDLRVKDSEDGIEYIAHYNGPNQKWDIVYSPRGIKATGKPLFWLDGR